MRAMRTLGMLKMTFATMVMVVLAGPAGADDGTKRVHCERGQSLAKALENARPGDTFLLSGTCHERVTIAVDRITLDGQGSAVIHGGGGGPAEFSAVVTIKSASGVTIKGLTVSDGPGEGILARGGASFTLQAAQVHGNAFTGVSVGGNSTAEVIDANIHHNGLGVDVYTGSSLILKGTIAIMHNSGNGVDINGEAVLEIRGAHVQASDNKGTGIVVGSGQLAIFNLTSSVGSSVNASHNDFAGILVAASRLTAYPPCTITVADNFIGLIAASSVVAVVNGSAEFVAENNAIGLSFVQNANGIFQGGPLTVRNNKRVGLLADGAGTLIVESDPAKPPSRIEQNGTDVDLRFGTRATFQGVTIGSITCDATVLSRGTTVCP